MKLNSPHARGICAALACSLVLGSAVAAARFAYDGGASGIVVALGRSVVMITMLVIILKLMKQPLHLPRKLVPLVIVNGALMALMTYGNIGAVEFISVGLAALLFFTFPVIIAILVMVFRIESVSLAKMAAVFAAFVGVAVMLGVSLGNVDGRGTALSLMGAMATAINAILVGRFFREINVFVVTLYFSLFAFVFLLLLAGTIAPVRFPDHSVGWWGIAAVAIFQSIGTPLYFYAIAKIGALETGMVTNVQPVTSIFEAWIMFDEVLSALQALGGGLVLLSIAFMQWLDLRRPKNSS